MGAGSLLRGDLLRQPLRSCLDYAGSNARAGGHAACSTSTFQGALEMTGRNLGILRPRIQPVE